MNLSAKISKHLLKRKLVTAVLISISIASFATLGDGGHKNHTDNLGLTPVFNPKNFSLRSGFNFKGNNLFTASSDRYIILNTVITIQRGNSTYVMPLKKKVLLDKIKINPAPSRF